MIKTMEEDVLYISNIKKYIPIVPYICNIVRCVSEYMCQIGTDYCR